MIRASRATASVSPSDIIEGLFARAMEVWLLHGRLFGTPSDFQLSAN